MKLCSSNSASMSGEKAATTPRPRRRAVRSAKSARCRSTPRVVPSRGAIARPTLALSSNDLVEPERARARLARRLRRWRSRSRRTTARDHEPEPATPQPTNGGVLRHRDTQALGDLGEEIILITAAERFLHVIEVRRFRGWQNPPPHRLPGGRSAPRRARSSSRRWFDRPVAGSSCVSLCAALLAAHQQAPEAIELPQGEAGETEKPEPRSGLRAGAADASSAVAGRCDSQLNQPTMRPLASSSDCTSRPPPGGS